MTRILRTLLPFAVLGALLFTGLTPRAVHAAAHGCISATRDYSAQADAFRRSFGLNLHSDEPCTFVYSPGDRYTGSGRFLVTCSSGGSFFHPDYRDDRVLQPDVYLPIPQPCSAGDTVTVDGYYAGTGGAVAAGGLSRVPTPNSQMDSKGFESLCDDKTGSAAVRLDAPADFNGLLTYGGSVDCRGANVKITSVTITGLNGWPAAASAGTAECHRCQKPVSVEDTVQARWTEWDVEMRFSVSRPGRTTVHGVRVGRYVTTWGGNVTQMYPNVDDALLAPPAE